MTKDAFRAVSCELAKSGGEDMATAHAEKWLGRGVGFERVRRITGYLGSLNRFNNAKRCEERNRVKHG